MKIDIPPGPLDVPALVHILRETFKGCVVEKSKGVGMSGQQCLVKFDVYELRVIMSRIKDDRTRDMHIRFMQRFPVRSKINKVVLIERKTTDPKVLIAAIKETKAHLLGCVHAIHSALNEKPVHSVQTIDDLFDDG